MKVKPTNKVTVGAVVGGVCLICAWIVEEMSGTKIPTEVVVATQTVGVFIAQWATSDEPSNS